MPENRKKIAYIATWDLGHDDAVVKKIEGQLLAWEEAGFDVRLFAVSANPCVRPALAKRSSVVIRRENEFSVGRASGRKFIKSIAAWNKLDANLSKWSPDLIYLRHQTWFPGLGGSMRRAPSFIEINSRDLVESVIYGKMWGIKAKMRTWYHKMTRGIPYRNAAGLVGMTRELLDLPEFSKFGKPGIVIPNSIPLEHVPELPPRADDGDPRPVIILSASGGHHSEKSHWHGVDKVVRLAHRCEKQLRFLILGPGLIRESKPGSNVEVLGAVSPDELAAVYQRADVAFGTLALHRKQMDEACAFKVRDALAFGLPVIQGCRDAAFDGVETLPEWWLQLPNTEENLDECATQIVDFATRWKGRRIPRNDVLPIIDRTRLERRKLDFMLRTAENA